MHLVKQPLCCGHADLGLARIVGIESLDGASEHAAGLVDPVERNLGAILLLLSPVGERAAEDCGNADFYRLSGLRE